MLEGNPAHAEKTRQDDAFARALLAWYDTHGRKDLPWQRQRTPYRVWLGEVMLQQTQVRTVIPYFERFVAALPTLPDLAAAAEDRVLALWSGLGYYSRARNLHRTAQRCVEAHAGDLPRDITALSALPGIGRSTAAAILAQACGERHAILDGNVRRVLARRHGVRGWPGSTATQHELWGLAKRHTPHERVADYTQAIMDLGATLCTRSRPQCARCPVASGCVALREDLTAELPESKPRRDIPTRATTLLIARDVHGRVLLERRPPSGVWARLWSLPEARDTRSAARVLRDRLGLKAGRVTPLESFMHVFSHYRLEITPLICEPVSATRVQDDADRLWYSRAELAALGLPAPVRRLLESLP
ncbi:MAG: A/G-specific adenine glycosylase [Rhodanobacter sp.]|jgi:A/G-specific adenine glycosylase|nr:A/G-specific adenine glycosylase [Rhodanobacter sp.]